jgi:hypothetical protein
MLSLFDKQRATYFSHCCGAATHFNPKLPYRPVNTGILFAMEHITPFDPDNEEPFNVPTSQGILHFCGVTSTKVKANPKFNESNTTFSGDYMGSGRLDMNNNGEGVFPMNTIKHGQFMGMVTNKTYQEFIDHKGVCLWVDVIPSGKGYERMGDVNSKLTFYGLLTKNPEFKEFFDSKIIYKSDLYCNMRENSNRILQLIVTDNA